MLSGLLGTVAKGVLRKAFVNSVKAIEVGSDASTVVPLGHTDPE